jgi:probable rRNA maturation factor
MLRKMPGKAHRAANEASAGLSVNVQLASVAATVPSRARILRWVRAAAPARADITVRVVDTREARKLNRAYGGADYATNVLAFPYGRVRGALAGDVVLCAPVIAREAREQRKDPMAHYAHMTVHGVLHLRGHLHDDEARAVRMERAERAILRRLGYPDPYE